MSKLQVIIATEDLGDENIEIGVDILEDLIANNIIPFKVEQKKIQEYTNLFLENFSTNGIGYALNEMFSSANGSPLIRHSVNKKDEVVYLVTDSNHRLVVLRDLVRDGTISPQTPIPISLRFTDYNHLFDDFLDRTFGKPDAAPLRYLFSFGKLVETYFLNENLDVSNVDLDDMKFVNKMITLMDSFYQTFLKGYSGQKNIGDWQPRIPEQLQGKISELDYKKFIINFTEKIYKNSVLNFASLGQWSDFLSSIQRDSPKNYRNCFDVVSDIDTPSKAEPLSDLYEEFAEVDTSVLTQTKLAALTYAASRTTRSSSNVVSNLVPILKDVMGIKYNMQDQIVDRLLSIVKNDYYNAANKSSIPIQVAVYAGLEMRNETRYAEDVVQETIQACMGKKKNDLSQIALGVYNAVVEGQHGDMQNLIDTVIGDLYLEQEEPVAEHSKVGKTELLESQLPKRRYQAKIKHDEPEWEDFFEPDLEIDEYDEIAAEAFFDSGGHDDEIVEIVQDARELTTKPQGSSVRTISQRPKTNVGVAQARYQLYLAMANEEERIHGWVEASLNGSNITTLHELQYELASIQMDHDTMENFVRHLDIMSKRVAKNHGYVVLEDTSGQTDNIIFYRSGNGLFDVYQSYFDFLHTVGEYENQVFSFDFLVQVASKSLDMDIGYEIIHENIIEED